MERVREAPLWVKIVVPAVIVLGFISSVAEDEGSESGTEEASSAVEEVPATNGPVPPPPAAQAKETVRSYYRLVNEGGYRQAWGLIAPSLRADLGGFREWRAGHRYTKRTELTKLRTVLAGADQVVLAIRIVGVSRDACDEKVRQVFEGTWTLNRRAEKFVGTGFDVEQVGGGEATVAASECPPEEPTETAVGPPVENCDPNYSGACLDPNASDYDCAGGSGDGPQYTGEVMVVGSDPHGLDSDGDGLGCE
jgi:hypothetical protein